MATSPFDPNPLPKSEEPEEEEKPFKFVPDNPNQSTAPIGTGKTGGGSRNKNKGGGGSSNTPEVAPVEITDLPQGTTTKEVKEATTDAQGNRTYRTVINYYDSRGRLQASQRGDKVAIKTEQGVIGARITTYDPSKRNSGSFAPQFVDLVRESSDKRDTNAPFVYGYRPVASTKDGGYVFQAERTGERYSARPRAVGSNITSYELSVMNPSNQIKKVLVKPSLREDFLASAFKQGSAIANNRGVVKVADFVETKVNPVVFPIVKQGVVYTLKGLDKANKLFAEPDYSNTPLANTSFAKNGGILGLTKRLGQKILAFEPKLETLPSLSGATALGITQKVFTPAVIGLRNVAGEFITYASTKPVTTYLSTFGLRRVLGKFAYGVLDKADVFTSVVTESSRTYLSGKGILASVSAGAGAFAGEKVSDKTIGVFDFARPTTITTDNVFSTKFNLKSRDTFVVTPRVSASGKVSTNQFTVKYGVTPSFKTYTKLPSVKSLNIGRFGTPEPVVFYESTVLQADVKPFGKSTLPKYISVDLNTGVLKPTRATLRSRYTVRIPRLFSGRNSLFSSKRGQMSLFGSSGDSSYTGTAQDFAGRFGDFTGRYSTTEPEAPTITNKPIAKILSRTRVRVQRSFAQSQPKALSLTQTQITTKFKPRLKTLTFDSIKSRTGVNALTRSLTQDLTQSLTETPTLSLTQSLTQTQTRSLTVTPTLTRTLTQTRTLTRTPTRTPTVTLTATFPKLSKLFKKPKAFKTPKTIMRTLKEDYYTPSLFAVAFNKRGRETRLLTVSGLGIRPIRLR